MGPKYSVAKMSFLGLSEMIKVGRTYHPSRSSVSPPAMIVASAGITGSGDRLSVLGEGTLVDHRGGEVGKISDVTDASNLSVASINSSPIVFQTLRAM